MKFDSGVALGQWVLALVAAGVSLLSYVYSNFTTVREKDQIDKRLDRIESKIDVLLEK